MQWNRRPVLGGSMPEVQEYSPAGLESGVAAHWTGDPGTGAYRL